MTPFMTFYTPTYRRPKHLAACMASVADQTAFDEIEHLIVADYDGVGIAGMYERVWRYAAAAHGRYVHVLSDDEVLAGPDVVDAVKAFAIANRFPAVIVARLVRDGGEYPHGQAWPPQLGSIGLGCLIVRNDVWRWHADAWGKRYEGDFDFASALYQEGYEAAELHMRFVVGDAMFGRPEEEVA